MRTRSHVCVCEQQLITVRKATKVRRVTPAWQLTADTLTVQASFFVQAVRRLSIIGVIIASPSLVSFFPLGDHLACSRSRCGNGQRDFLSFFYILNSLVCLFYFKVMQFVCAVFFRGRNSMRGHWNVDKKGTGISKDV